MSHDAQHFVASLLASPSARSPNALGLSEVVVVWQKKNLENLRAGPFLVWLLLSVPSVSESCSVARSGAKWVPQSFWDCCKFYFCLIPTISKCLPIPIFNWRGLQQWVTIGNKTANKKKEVSLDVTRIVWLFQRSSAWRKEEGYREIVLFCQG